MNQVIGTEVQVKSEVCAPVQKRPRRKGVVFWCCCCCYVSRRFLRHFPVVWYGTVIGLTSQAFLWRSMVLQPSMSWLKVPEWVPTIVWGIGFAWFVTVSSIYILKAVVEPGAVRAEIGHPVRVNFFFGPIISTQFLLASTPFGNDWVNSTVCETVWWCTMVVNFFLSLRLYWRWWLSMGGLNMSACNPTYQISVVSNFVGGTVGAMVGQHDVAKYFFATGLLMETVLVVHIFGSLHNSPNLPLPLRPVMFLFIAPPSAASSAWGRLNGWDNLSTLLFFIGLTFYFLMFVNLDAFFRLKFSLAWWACTFPMTASALAFMDYATFNTTVATQVLSFVSCTLAVCSVAIMTTLTAVFTLTGRLLSADPVLAKSPLARQQLVDRLVDEASHELKDNGVPSQMVNNLARQVAQDMAVVEENAPSSSGVELEMNAWGMPNEVVDETMMTENEIAAVVKKRMATSHNINMEKV